MPTREEFDEAVRAGELITEAEAAGLWMRADELTAQPSLFRRVLISGERMRSILRSEQASSMTRSRVALNSDCSTSPDLARALHRVVRAMHDGNCPKCGVIVDSEDMRLVRDGWSCPRCGFSISEAEAKEALAEFQPFLKANLAAFEEWRSARRERLNSSGVSVESRPS